MPFDPSMMGYLLGMGAGAWAGPNSFSGRMAPVLGQAYGAKSMAAQNEASRKAFMEWMQSMLGKEGSKMTIDNKGWSMKGTNEAMQSILGGTVGSQTGGGNIAPPEMPTGFSAGPNTPVPGATPPAPMNPGAPGVTEPTFPTKAPGQYILNPSVSPSGGASLAGLSAADVARALELDIGVGELMRKSAADWQTYSTMSEANRLKAVEEARRWAELNQEAPLTMPDGTPMTLEDFKAMPEDVRSYYAYVKMQRSTNPNEPLMSFANWKNVDKETRSQFVSWIMGDESGQRLKVAKEVFGGTKISIGEKAETKEALDAVEARTYHSSPQMTKDLEKHLNDIKSPWYGNKAKTREETIRYITKSLNSSGNVLDLRFEGTNNNIVVWTVEWKDGKTTEVKYEVGPRTVK